MTRKEFLNLVILGICGFSITSLNYNKIFPQNISDKKIKNWIWFHPWNDISDDEYKRRLEKIKLSGIDALLPGIYSGVHAAYNSKIHPISVPLLEKLLPLAKSMDLEVHAWMWTMICNDERIIKDHPDWFSVSRNGDSSIDKPAYVGYYRFLCPNNPGVINFISNTVEELSNYSELDGVHLDYVRYPDVILAKKLQEKYNIVQDKEYPEYDFCYCENCSAKFKDEYGINILESKNPEENLEWRNFRYQSITNLVNNHLVPKAKEKNKIISAAVFPNWENVRQQWYNWNVDAVLPMLYNGYYDEGIDWIVDHVKKGKSNLKSSAKLYSGLMTGSFNPDEFKDVISKVIDAKADGVALFAYHGLSDEQWKVLSEIKFK